MLDVFPIPVTSINADRYAVEISTPVLQTKFASDHASIRRIGTRVSRLFNIEMTLNDSELEILMEFFNDIVFQSELPFEIELYTSSRPKNCIVRFDGDIRCNFVERDINQVSFRLTEVDS